MSKFGNSSARLLLPFGLEHSDVLQGSDYGEKPILALPVHGTLTKREEEAAMQNILFAALVADGPFYTGSLNAAKSQSLKDTEQSKLDSRVALDGIPRYSDRYKKPKKLGAAILDHPFHLDFFPSELYSLMGITKKTKRKLLSVSSFKANGGLPEYASNQSESLVEKLKTMADTLDENADENNENPEDEEEIDDDFDEDEDDDYNAERYFDDGDDDMGDAGDGDEAAF